MAAALPMPYALAAPELWALPSKKDILGKDSTAMADNVNGSYCIFLFEDLAATE